ncbi:hypothetical protein CPB83DRAFT_862450 [Crepidotus variabilis]|uniref:Uncharacterized protein n=1 Tax=Crepidotus variabilis TaxID=179855 RepID=A0A9P6JKC6_9AGAR|nr:hypothetical protein CPB83DRAFT_862450 [Crepidotus variabilis]
MASKASSQAVASLRHLRGLTKRVHVAAIIRLFPKFAKLLVALLFLINIRSWPLAWHIRIFRPVLLRRFQHAWLRARTRFLSRTAQTQAEDRWLDSICPIAANPQETTITYRSWASPDDSDWNLHMSNSCYPKILDGARLKAAVELFPMFFRAGGWLPLAATHFHFVKEIPMLSSYEVRLTMGAWDHKWMYVIGKFVCKPNGKKKRQLVPPPSQPVEGEATASQIIALGNGDSEAVTSSIQSPSGLTPAINNITGTDTRASLNAVAAQLAGKEADGAVLHTIAVSQICFKIGRITIPPSLVLATNGFTGISGYTTNAPHPQWAEAKKIMSYPAGGSPRKLREFLSGGWKNVPDNERWWEIAMGPDVEQKRLKNMSLIDDLRKGMESVGSI